MMPRLYTLKEAAAMLGGGLTARVLRAELKRGRLTARSIGGKYLVTETDLAEFVERCRVGENRNLPACGSDHATDVNPNGSSLTPGASAEQAAASATAKVLKGRSRNTSRTSTAHPQAQVIPIR
jgi:hypothetical protein